MRDTDVRSKAIALTADAIVNAHLVAEDSSARAAAAVQTIIERLGFGVIQLPPADIPFEKARRALELAIDQTRDYAANGYRIVAVGLDTVSESGLWRAHLQGELNRRGIVLGDLVVIASGAPDAALADVERRLSVAAGASKQVVA